ncbi:hypothetical protein K431DRAFT_101549 [Polychaeton citri CBS 116435]|uniref:Uncharacterized protein n=1 Tax=Polychaeton citri CBS 116435 TaxID=1314669 RepID=A0A9P4QFP7_9PEZI|nr:hypothetical protein K431DRAFT_101549 [Polychaeton citri CBS 116435]
MRAVDPMLPPAKEPVGLKITKDVSREERNMLHENPFLGHLRPSRINTYHAEDRPATDMGASSHLPPSNQQSPILRRQLLSTRVKMSRQLLSLAGIPASHATGCFYPRKAQACRQTLQQEVHLSSATAWAFPSDEDLVLIFQLHFRNGPVGGQERHRDHNPTAS